MDTTVGQRVALRLPNSYRSGRWERVEGVVAAIDEPGRPRGVRVRFDRLFNGVDNCLASVEELEPA
jgi:hypothetical protein